jgi:hypothetical protein
MTQFDQARIAHLQMIQSVIARMAGNCFALKAASVTLTTGAVALLSAAKSASSPYYVVAGVLPIVTFWWLDAKYLQLERLYRQLYDAVRRNEASEPFAMDTRPYVTKVASVRRIAWSWSVAGIYAVLLAVLVVASVTMAVAGK